MKNPVTVYFSVATTIGNFLKEMCKKMNLDEDKVRFCCFSVCFFNVG